MKAVILKDKSVKASDTYLAFIKNYWDNTFKTKLEVGDTIVIYPLKGGYKREDWLEESCVTGIVTQVEDLTECTTEEWTTRRLNYSQRIHFSHGSLDAISKLPSKIFEKIDSMRQDKCGKIEL